jgi:hypothetical protein
MAYESVLDRRSKGHQPVDNRGEALRSEPRGDQPLVSREAAADQCEEQRDTARQREDEHGKDNRLPARKRQFRNGDRDDQHRRQLQQPTESLADVMEFAPRACADARERDPAGERGEIFVDVQDLGRRQDHERDGERQQRLVGARDREHAEVANQPGAGSKRRAERHPSGHFDDLALDAPSDASGEGDQHDHERQCDSIVQAALHIEQVAHAPGDLLAADDRRCEYQISGAEDDQQPTAREAPRGPHVRRRELQAVAEQDGKQRKLADFADERSAHVQDAVPRGADDEARREK